MKKLSPISVFVLVMLTIFMNACQSTKSATSKPLRFNLEKGKTYNYELVADLDQSLMGQSSKTALLTSYTVNVTEDQGDLKTLSFMYNDLKLDMSMAGVEIHVDSDKPVVAADNNDQGEKTKVLFNKIFSAMMGKKFYVTVNPEGKIIKVTGMEDFAAAIVDSLGLPEEARQQALQSTKQQFNSSDFESQFMPIFYIFPNKAVSVGDTWEKNYEVTGKMAAKNKSTYTVKQIEGNQVTLAVENKVSSNGGEVQVDGTNTGTTIVDRESGLVINSESVMDLTAKTSGMVIKMGGKVKARGSEKH